MDTLSEAPHYGDGAGKPSVGFAQTGKPSEPVHSSCDPSNESQPKKKRKVDHRNQGSSSQQASKKGGKDKHRKNVGRRRGTRPDGQANPTEAAEEGDDADEGEKTARLPKRRCALLIGFCGSGYNGMQVYVADCTAIIYSF
jgi:tRNA pseudouridine38-40 synthase